MPLDGFTLRYMVDELAGTLAGGHIDKIQQPDKTALLLTIRNAGKNHKLLVSINPSASRMNLTRASFENPKEAPAFLMLLRRRLVGGRITGITQLGCDRVAIINVETLDELGETARLSLILELTGRNSNIVLCELSGRIVDAARRVNASMNRVREILPGLIYSPPPPQIRPSPFSEEGLAKAREIARSGGTTRAIASALEGVGNVSAEEILARMDAGLAIPPASPCVLLGETGEPRDVLPFAFVSLAGKQEARGSLSEAFEDCFAAKDERERIARRGANLRKLIENNIDRITKKKAILSAALDNAAEIEREQKLGALITANIYRIVRGMDSVAVDDFEAEREITIALDPLKSASQNAQTRFSRARKMKTAAANAAEQMVLAEKTEALLETALQDLSTCQSENDIAEVRRALEADGVIRKDKPKERGKQRAPASSKPSLFISPDGIEILVGRTSLQNDSLTQAAKGEWTWLHAKDMPGSHVIIRSDAPGDVPLGTLAMALTLAAKNSRGSGAAKVPVDVTLRKFVKKPSGSPPGFVVYTNQRTYYVSPNGET